MTCHQMFECPDCSRSEISVKQVQKDLLMFRLCCDYCGRSTMLHTSVFDAVGEWNSYSREDHGDSHWLCMNCQHSWTVTASSKWMLQGSCPDCGSLDVVREPEWWDDATAKLVREQGEMIRRMHDGLHVQWRSIVERYRYTHRERQS